MAFAAGALGPAFAAAFGAALVAALRAAFAAAAVLAGAFAPGGHLACLGAVGVVTVSGLAIAPAGNQDSRTEYSRKDRPNQERLREPLLEHHHISPFICDAAQARNEMSQKYVVS